MIAIAEVNLPANALAQLGVYQAEVDSAPDYAAQIAAAKKRFSSRNKKSNATFNTIKATLTQMCSGSRRCMYCEDSCADEVEHIQPKDFYPEVVFAWGNYLYACGPCNGGKNNKYAIFDANDIEIMLTSQDPPVMPQAGTALFINPRVEDGMQFLALDLKNTFEFGPLPGLTQQDKRRAEYTRDILNLNRDVLRAARHEAFGNYRARLREYIQERDAARPVPELDLLVGAIKNLQHPTVWREMQRQGSRIEALKRLFEQAPEALMW